MKFFFNNETNLRYNEIILFSVDFGPLAIRNSTGLSLLRSCPLGFCVPFKQNKKSPINDE